MQPTLLGMDLEGVLIPEIWIAFAEKTGIEKLRLTTRDVKSYDELMTMRLKILRENKLKLADIQAVIETLDPLPGARDFVDWARSTTQFIVLSDTYYDFARPMMVKLGLPTLFCHTLKTDAEGFIADYCLRDRDSKRKAVEAFRHLGFYTVCAGDSYNDTSMLKAAHHGILFHAPENIAREFPQFPALNDFGDLRAQILEFFKHAK